MVHFPQGRTAGIVLCGGRSSRMGVDKATLRMPGGTLLRRMLAAMGEVAAPIALSLAATGAPPPTERPVLLVRDSEAYPGPLWGLAQAFRALQGQAEQVLVASVDLPFYTAAWMQRLLDGLSGHEACLYRFEGYTNALTAAYRLDLLEHLQRQVAQGQRRPLALIQGRDTRVLEIERLWTPRDGPSPVLDIDTPEDYRRALLAEGVGRAGGHAITLSVTDPLAPDPSDDQAAGRVGTVASSGLLPLFAGEPADVLHALQMLYADWIAAAARVGRVPAVRMADEAALPLLPSPARRRAAAPRWLAPDSVARVVWQPAT